MTISIDMTVPQSPKLSLGARLAAWAIGTNRRDQVRRVTDALDQLNGDQLSEIGLNRVDIPARAQAIIYQEA